MKLSVINKISCEVNENTNYKVLSIKSHSNQNQINFYVMEIKNSHSSYRIERGKYKTKYQRNSKRCLKTL